MIKAITLTNINKEALDSLEKELERITGDLHVPMMADIRRNVQGIDDREVQGVVDQTELQQAVQEAVNRELDARSVRGRRSMREIIEAHVPSPGAAAAPPASSDVAGQVIARLGRVRFDMLEEGEDVLGEGAFGTVVSGKYMGEEVAIKKARGVVRGQEVLNEFRCVLLDTIVGMSFRAGEKPK